MIHRSAPQDAYDDFRMHQSGSLTMRWPTLSERILARRNGKALPDSTRAIRQARGRR